MINHEPQEISSLVTRKPSSNPTCERNTTGTLRNRRVEIGNSRHHTYMKGQISRRAFLGRSLKTGLALAIPTILAKNVRGYSITYNKGRLDLTNKVNCDFIPCSHTTFHWPGGTDGLDSLDVGYNSPLEWISPVTTKIISRVFDSELCWADTRNLDSFAPVNLELSLHSEYSTSVNVSNLENWLKCIVNSTNKDYDFFPKPITLWRRFPEEPGKLQFLADIREALSKSNFYNYNGVKIAQVPLHALDGIFPVHSRGDVPETFETDPYDFLQVRFDYGPGDLDLNEIVDVKDLSLFGNDWGKKGQPLEFLGDITGAQGIPDGNVDAMDLELLTRHWLKNIRDIIP